MLAGWCFTGDLLLTFHPAAMIVSNVYADMSTQRNHTHKYVIAFSIALQNYIYYYLLVGLHTVFLIQLLKLLTSRLMFINDLGDVKLFFSPCSAMCSNNMLFNFLEIIIKELIVELPLLDI